MRLDGLALASMEPLVALGQLDAEVDRYRPDTPVSPALAEEARKGAERCRIAASRAVGLARRLEQVRQAATP